MFATARGIIPDVTDGTDFYLIRCSVGRRRHQGEWGRDLRGRNSCRRRRADAQFEQAFHLGTVYAVGPAKLPVLVVRERLLELRIETAIDRRAELLLQGTHRFASRSMAQAHKLRQGAIAHFIGNCRFQSREDHVAEGYAMIACARPQTQRLPKLLVLAAELVGARRAVAADRLTAPGREF